MNLDAGVSNPQFATHIQRQTGRLYDVHHRRPVCLPFISVKKKGRGRGTILLLPGVGFGGDDVPGRA
jgi:hypothetical protein